MVKVELPNNQAHQLRDEWENRLVSLKEEAAELEAAIKSIDAQLSGKAAKVETDEPQTKRTKGENFRAVHAFVKSIGVGGTTVAEIHKATHVPVSSCQYILKSQKDIFAKGNDGLWRIKRDAATL